MLDIARFAPVEKGVRRQVGLRATRWLVVPPEAPAGNPEAEEAMSVSVGTAQRRCAEALRLWCSLVQNGVICYP